MPHTININQKEMNRRCSLLSDNNVKPWLSVWGVPGPDESAGYIAADSNQFFDRQSKMEMRAKLARTPEIFGKRNPGVLSWRGSRPLCVSQPKVKEYYADLFPRILETYPDLEGLVFFPGDSDAEFCHSEYCEKCKATGLDSWVMMINYVNSIYESLVEIKPDFKFYFTVWNQNGEDSESNIKRFLDGLHPGIGICMSITDNYIDQRKSGKMVFNQPWVNFVKPGDSFQKTADAAHKMGRPIMVLGEISQAEVWDPVCHNMPNPRKVIDLLKNSEKTGGGDAVRDFWGHRRPLNSHANHCAMKAYFEEPDFPPQELLRKAAVEHYRLNKTSDEIINEALTCWEKFDQAVDHWALNMWGQRLSYAVGRDAARGFFYRALVPQNIRYIINKRLQGAINTGLNIENFVKYQYEDRKAFLEVASSFSILAEKARNNNNQDGFEIAEQEALNIELAGELIASVGRTFAAAIAFKKEDSNLLRSIIKEEIDARQRQLEITGKIGWGAGVNPLFVNEDIQNMCLFLSCDDFPHTPDECFSFTYTPFSM